MATIVSIATGNVVGALMSLFGVIGSIADMILTEVCPAYAKVAGGLGTISGGYSAVSTGASLFGLGPVGWVAGAICVAVGVSTMAIGVNEVISGATGFNHLREWTGMSQEDYNTLYLALNISSSICVIVGGLIGKAASRSNRTCRASNCFIAGTLVMTAAGLKKIEDIQVGDMVLAYDEETGEQAYKPVVQLFRNETKEWYHVRVQGEEIICTGGHPFYVLNASENRNTVCYESAKTDTAGKWVTAKELQISDKLLLSDGTCAIIEQIEVEQLATPETTYNFEVEDYHTYYVSDSKVLVHNVCAEDFEWSEGSFDSVEESLEYHTLEHGEEVGVSKTDINGYVKKSKNFAAEVVNRKVKSFGDVKGATPNVKRYHYNGKYIDMDKANRIIISFGKIKR